MIRHDDAVIPQLLGLNGTRSQLRPADDLTGAGQEMKRAHGASIDRGPDPLRSVLIRVVGANRRAFEVTSRRQATAPVIRPA